MDGMTGKGVDLIRSLFRFQSYYFFWANRVTPLNLTRAQIHQDWTPVSPHDATA